MIRHALISLASVCSISLFATSAQALSFGFSGTLTETGRSVTPGNQLSLKGSFSGDPGADGIIDASELSSFVASLSGSDLSTVFELPGATAERFEFDTTSNSLIIADIAQPILFPTGTGIETLLLTSTFFNRFFRVEPSTVSGVVIRTEASSFELVISPEAQEVPTPAPLLGLLGLGAAATRKRKLSASKDS